MKFGLFFQLPCAPDQSEAARYADTLAQIEYGEALGFDTAWLAELHFFRDFGVLSAPLVVAAAVAQRTRRIRVGLGVSLLPLHDPIHNAEQAATVDILSGGRLEFGVGRGTNALQYGGFHVPLEESRDRFTEALEVIIGAWTRERLTYQGKYYTARDLAVHPKPLQKPHPPVRIATNSTDSFQQAGEMGYPMSSSLAIVPLARLRRDLAAYWQAFEQAGHQRRGNEVALLFPVYVARTEAEALSVPRATMLHYFDTVARRMTLGGEMEDPATRERYKELQARLQRMTYEEVSTTAAIVGTAGQCIDRIEALKAEFGMSELICWFNTGGLLPHSVVLDSMERFASQVMPSVR